MNKSAVGIALAVVLLIGGAVVALNMSRWNHAPVLGPADNKEDVDLAKQQGSATMRDLPFLAHCPDFEFTDINGATVNRNQLAGRALLINLIDDLKTFI
jgi:hypothetical protein